MVILHSPEVIAPDIQFLMMNRVGVYAVFFDQGVGLAVCAVDVEFFFKKFIHCGVEGEREAWGSGNSKPSVQIKTSWAVNEKLKFTAA